MNGSIRYALLVVLMTQACGCRVGYKQPCRQDSECDDSRFCNGNETCDLLLGCLPGNPPCPDTGECDEVLDACASCGDGQVSSIEECDPAAGDTCCDPATCRWTGAGRPDPQLACSQAGDCQVDVCDGQGGCTTVNQPDGTACPDGSFCNGPETCRSGACTSQGDPCTGPDGDADCSESCDEAAGACTGPDPEGVLCDDGLYCTGLDSCDGAGGCSAHAGDPCAGQVCDEASDACTDVIFITDGLVGWWRLDQDSGDVAPDSSGNGYHGQLMNGPIWVTDTPPVNYPNAWALSFDGVDDYVTMQATELRDYVYDELTVTAWYKSAELTISDDEYVYYHHGGTSSDAANVIMNVTEDNDFDITPLRLHTRHNYAPSMQVTYGITDLSDMQWHHLAVVRGGGRQKVYVDGQLDGPQADEPIDYPGTISPQHANPGPYIGDEPGATEQVHGIVDDVRLYDRVLDQAEIQRIAAGNG